MLAFTSVADVPQQPATPGSTPTTSPAVGPHEASARYLIEHGAGVAHIAFVPVISLDSAVPPTPTPAPHSLVDARVAAVEQLLHNRPLAPYAALLVAEADRHGIDWRLMPVISILESQGGLEACGGNAWGYASCRVRFNSFSEAIPVVAATLAGYRTTPTIALCIWVSGSGCGTAHAVDYARKAAYLYARLGGSLPVPPPPPPPVVLAVADVAAATPAATQPPGTPTPAATPSLTLSPNPAATTATPAPGTPTPTPSPPPATTPTTTPTP